MWRQSLALTRLIVSGLALSVMAERLCDLVQDDAQRDVHPADAAESQTVGVGSCRGGQEFD